MTTASPPTSLASRTIPARAAVERRIPRVALVGPLAGCCAPGGGEVQLRSLADWLPAAGIDARLWRPWEDRWEAFDALHFIGSSPEWVKLAILARRARKPVFLSPVTWFSLRDLWREPWSTARRAWASCKFAARRVCPRLPSWRRRLYDAANMLLPNSRGEAEQLRRLFGVPADKLLVVPNGAHDRFARAHPELFIRATGMRAFVLCVGRIEPRKNQLNLLKALRGTGLPAVILGDVMPGHESYYAACRRAADANVRFMGRLDHDDPLLASAYAACRCLALVSWYETPGLAALEAAMSGTPLVLTRDGACQEYFGEHARYVAPGRVAEIRAAILEACQASRSAALATRVRANYSHTAVARATKEAYETLL